MDFQPGDIQLLNNAVILHSREAYEDHDDLDRASSPSPAVAASPRLRQRRDQAPNWRPQSRLRFARLARRENPVSELPLGGQLPAGPRATSVQTLRCRKVVPRNSSSRVVAYRARRRSVARRGDGVDSGSGGLFMVELFSLSECSLKPNISQL